MIVPRHADKRAAIMLDRIFGMMKDAVNGDPNLKAVAPDDRMDLQRRGQQKGRVYWRCYFNAVTCFRRK
ncbi:Allatostatin [Frankliniella fusca]|uniref:Allatostatin n=1 Tax=Frankliniella fusca TaxID=407009 RepID=A0AAE1L8D3_9NEOP|nr:Allatostatin [Frankliniella fusca]